MSTLSSIRDFIETCPFLEDFNNGIGIDCLSENATSYVIENTPVDPIVERFVDGSSEKRFAFVFASKEFYGEEVILNLEAIEFYENFTEWLDECNANDVLPKLNNGKHALEVNATITPYLYDEEIDKARYQIQCELIYFEPKK
ncbi:MAG: chloramphenicol resistance protein [Eubacterium sp.]